MKICLIYNFAQHYRTNIFKLMDKELDIDFVFGDHYLDVKKMDYSLLHHKVTEVKNKHIGPIDWQDGTIGLLFKGYQKFIMLGEPMNLSSWIILIFGRLMGKKIYFWTHGWYGKETRIKALIKKIYFGLANATMTYGNYAKGLMVKEGLNPERITVIHNSLMYDEQIEIRPLLRQTDIFSTHFENENPTIIFVGRLTKIKKLDMLLEAQAICKDRGFNINSVIVGTGTELDELTAICDKLSIRESVWFYGSTYNEQELSTLLYNADICVAPGNIGLTAMHAMVYGCPCISHNNFPYQMPEFEAIKEGVTGAFFSHNDTKSLADTIINWFQIHKHDRNEVRNACFKEIDEEWNPHVQLKRIKEAIGA